MARGWIGRLAQWAAGERSAPTARADRQDVQKALTEEVAAGYRPRTALAGNVDGSADLPSMQQVIWDIERMLAHARVHISMDYYKSGTAKAELEVEGSSPEVEKFALDMHQRFQARSHQDASRACDYGRGGYEVLYDVEDGMLAYQGLHPFFPLDCDVLTVKREYAGIRLRDTAGEGTQDLWGPTPSGIPPKGFWHAHNRRYNRWYGVPQPYPAWRSWRRLAGRDGAEEITDGGIYRFAYQGPLVRYPLEDLEPRSNYGQNNPTTGKITNRDKAREFAENAKAGASVAMSSRRDPETGQYLWDLDWPDKTLAVDGLLAYEGSLEKGISLGIGVPPELIEASEVGSGWSGRAIPMVAFYTGQQARAENLHEDYRLQIGLPLVRWNFGPGAWYKVRVKDLLKTMMGLAGGGGERPQPAGAQPIRFATETKGEEWVRFQGEHGGTGWKNTQTGEIRYQEKKPGKTHAGIALIERHAQALAQGEKGEDTGALAKAVQSLSPKQKTVLAGKLGLRELTLTALVNYRPTKKAPVPESAPASSGSFEPARHVPVVVDAIRATGSDNLASLVDVRRKLAAQGLDRAQQDAVIGQARREGKIVGVSIEGRHGISPAEREAVLEVPDPAGGQPERIGYLSLRLQGGQRFATSSWAPYQGPSGGSGWRNERTGEIRYQEEKPRDGQEDQEHGGALERIRAGLRAAGEKARKLMEFLDRKSDVPVVRQAKEAIGSALGSVKKAQDRLMQTMEVRYGKMTKRAILVAAAASNFAPGVPAWFVAIPGGSVLAQLPLMGVAEAALQAGKGGKALGRLARSPHVRRAAKRFARQLGRVFWRGLGPHREALAGALDLAGKES